MKEKIATTFGIRFALEEPRDRPPRSNKRYLLAESHLVFKRICDIENRRRKCRRMGDGQSLPDRRLI